MIEILRYRKAEIISQEQSTQGNTNPDSFVSTRSDAHKTYIHFLFDNPDCKARIVKSVINVSGSNCEDWATKMARVEKSKTAMTPVSGLKKVFEKR